MVAGAPIEARHLETGALHQTACTAKGNYALAQLPAGTYELSVTVPGFMKSVRRGPLVQVAQTLRSLNNNGLPRTGTLVDRSRF